MRGWHWSGVKRYNELVRHVKKWRNDETAKELELEMMRYLSNDTDNFDELSANQEWNENYICNYEEPVIEFPV